MIKRILLGLAVLFVVIQFIRPTPNVSTAPAGKDDFIQRFHPPQPVAAILQHACYDCHSNNTRYPWYAQVQPAGWFLASHVSDGKHELNLSEFGAYPAARQAKKLDHMSDQVSNHSMPLASYTWIHRDARLTDEQVKAFTEWCDALHDQMETGGKP